MFIHSKTLKKLLSVVLISKLQTIFVLFFIHSFVKFSVYSDQSNISGNPKYRRLRAAVTPIITADALVVNPRGLPCKHGVFLDNSVDLIEVEAVEAGDKAGWLISIDDKGCWSGVGCYFFLCRFITASKS